MTKLFLCPSALAFVAVFATTVQAQSNTPVQAIEVFPQEVTLNGPRDEQRIGVLATFADGSKRDVSRQATITSADPAIVSLTEERILVPKRDGQTQVRVSFGGQNATIGVVVKDAQAESPVSFTREIVPILTRAGCNQGACHGSQHGKGGFKLSLLGFDPQFDYAQIVQSAEGRRVVLSDPERSILLQKPTMMLEHGGKQRFLPYSREYNRLAQWLADGAPAPSRSDPHVVGLEIWPARRVMRIGEEQQLLVRAKWSDGKIEDVTPTVQFDTLNEGIAVVTPQGMVTAKGKGSTHIMVRFGGQAGVAEITLPYRQLEQFPDYPENNFIDAHLVRKWKSLGLTPSPLCDDATFLRRLYLDTIGTLPTPEEVRRFLADRSPDKRAKAIDAVLRRPEFIDYWALKWGDLLKINRNSMQERGMWSFHNWVRASIRDDKPVDQMVREIITAEGSTFTEGPANFFLAARNASEWAETTSQVFLGVRIGCAKCHHHPFEKWSQDDYYGMTAFFVRLGTKSSQEFGLFGREQVIYLRPSGEQSHPRKGGIVKPHPLDGEEMDDPLDRRVKLAQWLTSPNNRFFARNIVNRFWGYLMGRGLVEPLDDMRETNPPTNPELLDALAKDFIAHKHDLKHLIKTIVSSRAYQLSAKATEGNKIDVGNLYYARYTIRRLTAEQLADAIDFATGTQTRYPKLPLGTRAIQLPDSEVKSFFLETFGKPPRKITCECERTTQPNIAQAMHLMNGDFVNKKLSDNNGRIAKLFKAKKKLPEIVEELYLVTLSRPPRPAERQRALQWIAEAPNAREGVQDLLWALLNSREFLFNH